MKFTVKDLGTGYFGTNLLLPKRLINEQSAKNALTFILPERERVYDKNTWEIVGERGKELYLWDETSYHLIVPREFYTPAMMQRAQEKFEIIDERPEKYPRAKIKAKTKPFPQQLKPMELMLAAGGGTLNLRCGGGKTVIALLVAAELDVPLLVVVNNGSLMTQWEEEISKHLDVSSVGCIQAERQDWYGRPVVLSTIQTLSSRPELRCSEFRDYFGMVVYDECHHVAAPVFVQAADLCSGRRYGLTATAERTDGLENIYSYHLGRVFYRDLVQDLVPLTTFHTLRWSIPKSDEREVKDRSGMINQNLLRGYLGRVDRRNELITKRISEDLAEGRQILVLSHSVDHVQLLAKMCPSKTTGVIIGDTDQDLRFKILRGCNPVFGTFQLAREGLDKPTLDTLHVVTPFGNSNDLQQSWGRIQRAEDNKKAPVVHVYEDVGISQCSRPCQRLRKYLKALGYPFKKKEEDI